MRRRCPPVAVACGQPGLCRQVLRGLKVTALEGVAASAALSRAGGSSRG